MAHLRLTDMSLSFPLYQGSNRSLKKSLLAGTRFGSLIKGTDQLIQVQALKNVTLSIEHGMRVGLVGPNGAGKTTLLRVLAGIYEPLSGTVDCDGHVAALLDPAAGMITEATGRENITLRGLYMGLSVPEIQRHVDEITAFTGLGDFLEMPVRTYSAGMMIRLAFAISTCVQPEILLMDEWFAAGDAEFLAKAQKRMRNFVEDTSILVLASHSFPLLREWCDTGILLNQGEIKMVGPIDDVIAAYEMGQVAG